MQYGIIPPFVDRVSRLVLGSAGFDADRQELASALLDTFVAAGGTAIDTARQYGQSENMIGSWLRARDCRGSIFLITKGAHHSPDGTRRVTPKDIDADVVASLEALGVDSIDLYLLHRDDREVPVGPIVECLNTHQAAGRIRGFGASNWEHDRIIEANDYAAARGLKGFVASSSNLALAVPNAAMWPMVVSVAGDSDALSWYRASQMPLLPWSSQAGGFFSGRFSPNDPSDQNMVRVYYGEANWERLRRARELAGRYGFSPTQVALAWVLHQPFPTFPLIGPLAATELSDCLGALEVPLTDDDVAWLNLGS